LQYIEMCMICVIVDEVRRQSLEKDYQLNRSGTLEKSGIYNDSQTNKLHKIRQNPSLGM